MKNTTLIILVIIGVCACVSPKTEPTPPDTSTANTWPTDGMWEDQDDFVNAQRGMLGQLEPLAIPKDYHLGQAEVDSTHPAVWNLNDYADQMISGYQVGTIYPMTDFPVPNSEKVNQSLWRTAVLNSIHGVFEVVPNNIYQVRGCDVSNMTIVRAEATGDDTIDWIVIDPLMSAETAYAAWDNFTRLYGSEVQQTPRENHKIRAVIFTHAHTDHYAGIDGLTTFLTNDHEIWTPEGFLEHAISENVIAGNAMSRRATYMYGPFLEKSEDGMVDSGLGKTTSTGAKGLPAEENIVNSTWDPNNPETQKTVAGIQVYFQNVPGSEAPAEMLFYFPDYQALCAAEDVTHSFHNVLTLRGAQVRDPLVWAKYLDETIDLFIDGTVQTDVLFSSHHWPTWAEDLPQEDHPGTEMTTSDTRIKDIIEDQRDLYKYVHDQTVRLANHGFTIQEIAEIIQLPDSLNKWHNQGYYGTLNHNSKAVYQRYIGWFDGNPVSLHQLPPRKAGALYAKYFQDWNTVRQMALEDLDAGRYRGVAMLMNHYVYSDHEYAGEAKDILIACYNAMAVDAESGPWRNFYLTGASELAKPVNQHKPAPAIISPEVAEVMPVDMTLDYLAIRLNAPKVDEENYSFLLDFRNDDEDDDKNIYTDAMLYVKNGVLRYKLGDFSGFTPTADGEAIIHLTRDHYNKWLSGESDNLTHTSSGDKNAVATFFKAIDDFNFWFNIVTPNSSDNGGFIPNIIPDR